MLVLVCQTQSPDLRLEYRIRCEFDHMVTVFARNQGYAGGGGGGGVRTSSLPKDNNCLVGFRTLFLPVLFRGSRGANRTK